MFDVKCLFVQAVVSDGEVHSEGHKPADGSTSRASRLLCLQHHGTCHMTLPSSLRVRLPSTCAKKEDFSVHDAQHMMSLVSSRV